MLLWALAGGPAHCAPAPLQIPGESGENPRIFVLGIAQDGGFPQAGCGGPCCARAWSDPALRRSIVSLGIVDPRGGQRWLLECTPDFREQLHLLDRLAPSEERPGIAGIFLTHAHIGHYAGLMHLGREAMGAQGVPVHVLPRMAGFLRDNAPWSQLAGLGNISLQPIRAGVPVEMNERLRIRAIAVPHRDEFSETAAFVIEGPTRKALFLPDIDKWERWEQAIEEVVAGVDIAWLDATFWSSRELPGRDMAEIPHPLVEETIARFAPLDRELRSRIRLIHFNHTNPLLDDDSPELEKLRKAGLGVAREGDCFEL